MTLNASGPISLGGSTAGQSINLELGVSATALASINASNFRALAGVASGQISLSNFYGKSSIAYGLGQITWTGGNYFGAGPAGQDSAGNFYIASYSPSNTRGYLGKYSATGSLIWQINLPALFNPSGTQNVAPMIWDRVWVDSSFNIYFAMGGYYASSNYISVVKLTSSGTLVWQSNYGRGFGSDFMQGSSYLDSSNNFYFTAMGSSAAGYPYMVKTNSSGALVWAKQIPPASPNFYTPSGLTLDSSGNVWTFISTSSNYQQNQLRFWPNSAGTVTTSYFDGGTSFIPGKLAPSGTNVFFSGVNGYSNNYIGRINSSGTVLWSKTITGFDYGSSGFTDATWCDVDSSGNVYFTFAAQGSVVGSPSYSAVAILKFNSSGTLQWQRFVRSTTSIYANRGLSVGSTGLVIGGAESYNTYGPTVGFFTKVPLDGSKTGTYTVGSYTIVYGVSTLSVADAGISYSGGTSNIGDFAPVQPTGTYSFATASATNVFVTI